jgi:hypothetical protein
MFSNLFSETQIFRPYMKIFVPQLLLSLARGIFQEQTSLEKLVQKIMLDAQDLLKCERCSVYLIDDTVEKVSFSFF